MTHTTTTPKKRTITLTGRPPVTIREDEWPVIAHGYADHDDSHNPGNPPNREWERDIRVREHADGRVLVYGTYSYSTCIQGENGAGARAGLLLATPVTHEQIIDAIRMVSVDDAALYSAHDFHRCRASQYAPMKTCATCGSLSASKVMVPHKRPIRRPAGTDPHEPMRCVRIRAPAESIPSAFKGFPPRVLAMLALVHPRLIAGGLHRFPQLADQRSLRRCAPFRRRWKESPPRLFHQRRCAVLQCVDR